MISKDYQFPKITTEMFEEIKKFNKQVCGDDAYAGALGGGMTFHIIPTSIGDLIEVEVRGHKKVIGEYTSNINRDDIKIVRCKDGYLHAEIPELDLSFMEGEE